MAVVGKFNHELLHENLTQALQPREWSQLYPILEAGAFDEPEEGGRSQRTLTGGRRALPQPGAGDRTAFEV